MTMRLLSRLALSFFMLLLSLSTQALNAPIGIINGSPSAATSNTWQVALTTNNRLLKTYQFCGASLIGDKWVLTAAHCLDTLSKHDIFYATVGISNLDDPSTGQVILVKNFYTHPDFDSETFDNDIALIELDHAVNFSQCQDYCSIIALASEGTVAALTEKKVTISGWGKVTIDSYNQPTGSTPSQLNTAQLDIIPCVGAPSLLYSEDVTSNMFCAAALGWSKDSCQGDSGGPLSYMNKQTPELLGVISFGFGGCATPYYPGVYTKVENYLSWLTLMGFAPKSTLVEPANTPTITQQSQAANSTPSPSQPSSSDSASGGSTSLTMFTFLILLGMWRKNTQRSRYLPKAM
jgi:secreted trypsin-like serine protease